MTHHAGGPVEQATRPAPRLPASARRMDGNRWIIQRDLADNRES